MSGEKSDRIAKLRARYAERLPTRLEELGKAYADATSGAGTWETVRTLAHNLAGSAGGYGFGDLGERANAIQILLRAAAEAGRAPDPGEREKIEQALAEMAPERVLGGSELN